MSRQRCVAVFCASSHGARAEYEQAALALGRGLGALGIGLVYGGAAVGLMGTLADAALSAGAPVIGVLPAVLRDREIAHRGLTELHFVGSMHERKAMMAEQADAFLALPGGYGTLDEFVEVLTWAQLGLHAKPCVLINLRGFYDSLLLFLDHAVEESFLQPRNRALVQVAGDVESALLILRSAPGAPLPASTGDEALSNELVKGISY